ncbi:DUF1576 domain-containing protein [Mycoplasma sp. P36-A1]|uniref:DUF1576 domain-containing protein n=1 Tax=Mycoplasma sp. P36-A1 TaxID=3252900 RepID=UPI003C2F17B6
MLQPYRQEKLIYQLFYILIAGFMITAFATTSITDLFNGLIKIITMEEVLITDYFEVAGFGPALLNTSLVTLLTLSIIRKTGMRMNGLAFAAIFTLIGFSFFGKNVYNILPIYFGVFLYANYVNEPLKNFFLIAIFSTCLAPLIGSNFTGTPSGFILGIAIGIVYGFVIAPLASHVMRFHNGYTLYNVGFAGGMFAIVIASIIKTMGFELTSVYFISDEYHYQLLFLSYGISIVFIILALINKTFSLKDYLKLTKRSGRAVTDYFALHNPCTVYMNIGVMGISITTLALACQVPFNGPIIGAIFTIMGFSAFGASPVNACSVIIGAALMHFLSGNELKTEYIITLIFVVGISPIAGQYGPIYGILAGMMHYSIVCFSGSWQGAFNLYNNGFASGIVAGVLVSIIDNIRKVEWKWD